MESDQVVNGVEVEEFNRALDRILDSFRFGSNYEEELSSVADNEDLRRAQNTYDRLTADVQNNDGKKQEILHASSIPKVMKNDIRRYYSRMLMNTLNSADFTMLQDYFSTFMCGTCKFVVNTSAPQELAIPQKIVVEGPRLVSHYTLGCFVQYPDMVMSMTDSKIVTSNSWAGTKIVMQVQFKATKTFDIDIDSWIPQLATLLEGYEATQKEDALVEAIARNNHVEFSKVHHDYLSSVPTSTTTDDVIVDRGSSIRNVNCTERYSSMHRAVSTGSIDLCTIMSPSVHSFGDINRVSPIYSPAALTTASVNKTAANTVNGALDHCTALQGTRVGDKRKTDQMSAQMEPCSTKISTETSSITQRSDNSEYIPESWVRSLMARAKLLPEPIPMFLRGELILFLDENNHIQHMCETCKFCD